MYLDSVRSGHFGTRSKHTFTFGESVEWVHSAVRSPFYSRPTKPQCHQNQVIYTSSRPWIETSWMGFVHSQMMWSSSFQDNSKNGNRESLENMSFLKGHYLHKVYVQMLVQRVHNWIHQSAVAHLGTQGTRYELSILSVTMDSLVLEGTSPVLMLS